MVIPFLESYAGRAEATPDPAAWDARLEQGPCPLDGRFWAVTEEGDAVEVAYDAEAVVWIPPPLGPFFVSQDDEARRYGADEIVGWSLSPEIAAAAADLFQRTLR